MNRSLGFALTLALSIVLLVASILLSQGAKNDEHKQQFNEGEALFAFTFLGWIQFHSISFLSESSVGVAIT